MSNRMRALVGGVASLGVVGTSVALYAVQAPEHTATRVTVDDTAGILHEPTLRAEIGDVRFHEPTDVAVFTHRGGREALTDDLALNDAVLAHAQEARPEWLSADEQKWADDLFVFAVDPEGRLVGTYFGENRKVGQDAQLEIQEATKDDLRAGRWTEGAVAGVEDAARRMSAPFARTDPGMALAGGASVATIAGAGAFLAVGVRRARRSREARAEGDRRMANVIRDVDVTELHAHLIPEGSRYGGAMLRRYDEYSRGLRELTDLGNEARSIKERDYDSRHALERLTAYQDKARSLDRLDGVIADTAAFLNRDRAWTEAWHRQVAPVRLDLEQVEPLLGSELPEEARGLPEAQALREYASGALARLDELRGDLEAQSVCPDDALDELRRTRDGLSGHLDRLAGAVAGVAGEDEAEQTMITDAMREQRSRRVHESSILSASDPAWSWYAVSAFRTGYSTGAEEVEQSRSSSSGGSSSGYSSGSFSGAGSSSRF